MREAETDEMRVAAQNFVIKLRQEFATYRQGERYGIQSNGIPAGQAEDAEASRAIPRVPEILRGTTPPTG
jgi:hypothetical protein